MHLPTMKEVMECERHNLPCRNCHESALCKAEFVEFLRILVKCFS